VEVPLPNRGWQGGLEGDINSSNNNNSVSVHSLGEWGDHHLEDSRTGWGFWGTTASAAVLLKARGTGKNGNYQ
jgi:hypothetical protein